MFFIVMQLIIEVLTNDYSSYATLERIHQLTQQHPIYLVA